MISARPGDKSAGSVGTPAKVTPARRAGSARAGPRGRRGGPVASRAAGLAAVIESGEGADEKNRGCSEQEEPDRTSKSFGIHNFIEHARFFNAAKSLNHPVVVFGLLDKSTP